MLLPNSGGVPRQAGRHLYKSMPDDHSKLVPPLPIPNRTVKQLCADDSAATSVKVGYRQASYKVVGKNPTRQNAQDRVQCRWGFFLSRELEIASQLTIA